MVKLFLILLNQVPFLLNILYRLLLVHDFVLILQNILKESLLQKKLLYKLQLFYSLTSAPLSSFLKLKKILEETIMKKENIKMEAEKLIKRSLTKNEIEALYSFLILKSKDEKENMKNEIEKLNQKMEEELPDKLKRI